MPYSREDDWARKFKMRSSGMFSTPSYWGVGEPFDDSLSGEPTPSQLAAARATVGSLVSLGLPCGWLACDWCPAPPWRCPTARHLVACAHLVMFVCVQAATRARGGCR